MRLWTLIKIIAGAVVISATAFTFLTIWNNKAQRLKPLEKILPTQVDPEASKEPPMESLPKEESDAPDIDPGAEVFDKVRDVIALGDYASAREKLNTIVTTYPRSKAAPEARRIIGEMNMDDILSPAHTEGKTVHVVQKGESFIAIASKEHTNMDCILHLNGMLEMTGLRPGDELVVMPLDFRLVIEPSKKTLSVFKGGDFVREYHLLSADAGSAKGIQKTTVSLSYGLYGDKRVTSSMKGYRDSQKVILLTKSSLQIRSGREADDAPSAPGTPGKGFIMAPEDAEELALIVRPGNEVEIRSPAP